MDGFFTDWAEDDDYFEDEEDFVNRNDPLGTEREFFSPYEELDTDKPEIEEFVEKYSEVQDLSKREVNKVINEYLEANDIPELGIQEAMAAAGIIGGMISDENREADEATSTFVNQVDKISLKQAMEKSKTKTKKLVVGPEPLRPFEQWLQDVFDGKRSFDENL